MDISTPRLLLTLLQNNDAGFYSALYTNATVMQHVGTPLTQTQLAKSFQRLLSCSGDKFPTSLTWVIREQNSNVAIGIIGINDKGQQLTQVESGLLLLPEYWQAGYATEAYSGLLTFLKMHFNCKQAEAHIHPLNQASIALHLKLQFILEDSQSEMHKYVLSL